MSKNDRQHARQPVSRVTRNQPSSPRSGKGPIKPAGGAPQGRESQGHGSQGHAQERRHAEDKRRYEHDERKPFGKQGESRFGGKGRSEDERHPGEDRQFGKGDRFKVVGSQGRFDDERRFGEERRPGNKPFGKQGESRFGQGRDEGRFGEARKPGNKPFGKQGEPRFGQGRDEGRFGEERKPGNKPFGKQGEPRFGQGRDEGRFGDERKPGNKPFGKPSESRFGQGRDEGRFGEGRKPGNKPFGKSEPRFGRDEDRNAEQRKPYGKSSEAKVHFPSDVPRAFGEERQYGKPKASPVVARAKKLQVRDPNQKVMDRAKQLRETRVDIDEVEPVRVQKALAASGAGSRREMEQAIEAGQVLINGKPASLGDKVGPRDRVTLQGHQIKLKWADRLPRVIIYHKQEGEIVSRDDPGGRVTVFDRLPQAKSSRWVTIGRLDVNTSGLLIITTSGELANRLAHPSFEAEREYAVRVLGELTDEQKKAMTSEVLLDDGPAKFDRLIDQGGEGANHWYRVVIKEGRNREVRRMFEAYGLTVSRLIRLRFGPVGLPNRLKRGQFYELNELEVANVMKWAGLTATGQVKAKR